MQTKYVAGFMFSPDKQEVVLVRKQKPDWQRGLLNGIGGKIEGLENPRAAMTREFEEETGFATEQTIWREFCRVNGGDWVVYFFTAIGEISRCYSKEIEVIERWPVAAIRNLNTIPNVQWLIPLALQGSYATVIDA